MGLKLGEKLKLSFPSLNQDLQDLQDLWTDFLDLG
jgi:hypothetical protein